MNNYLIKEKLVSCYMEYCQNDLKESCENTRLKVTNFFRNVMREIDKVNIKEVN